MAETFLSPVIEKLVDLLHEEVKSLKGVDEDVRSLRAELEVIEPLLKDAEAKLEKEDMYDAVKVWLKQIREEASRIEDVIDKYRYHLRQRRSRSGFTGSLRKAWYFIKALKPRHEIASEILSIKQSLSEIKGRGHGYGLRPLDQGSSSRTTDLQTIDPRLQSLFLEKDELVGIESVSTDLVAKLVEGASTRLIISLVGDGGIGKTTLAKKVYEDEVVKRHFESARAWITVSRPYNPTKVLKQMKKEFCKSRECTVGELDPTDRLIDCVKTALQTKRYVIFLDDVWEENFWGVIKLALPNNNEGSRVLITTRNAAVANSCKETPHDPDRINLQPWSPHLAWELFCNKAFKECQGICPRELKQLSSEIVRKCRGLPLVIATIASLLSTKDKVESEWRRVLDGLNSKVEMNSQFPVIQKILSLSYYDLPNSVRSCFLYFGVFPEDYSIYDEKLFKLWIADGFVKANGEKNVGRGC